jgi:cytochrome c oxidase subunit 1
MRRRIADYDSAIIPGQFTLGGFTLTGMEVQHFIMTIAAFLIFISVVIFLVNVVRTLKSGEVATGNVWNSRSPEWQVPSPMPAHNYEQEFEVVGEPYDYGLPGSTYVKFAKSGD